MFKSRCRVCKEHSYYSSVCTNAWKGHNEYGECIVWLGDEQLCEVSIGTIYCPIDNLEYLEWCLDKKVKL